MFDGYILCGTPRTGSTLLCNLLASTPSAGNPDSYYGRQFMADWAREWNLPDPASTGEETFSKSYLAAAIRAGKGGTGKFGLRLMRESLEDLTAILSRIFPGPGSDKDRFENAFGSLLYVHLSRGDKLAQAISYIKARQSGLWHIAPDGTEIERLAPPQEPRYDFKLIRDEVARLEDYDTAWNSWFTAQGITPLRVTYEELEADPSVTLQRICKALGIPAPQPDEVRPGVAKLSDATSAVWARRYRQDTRDNA
jgi:trehalose 2-sulfotransferase